MGPLFLCLYGEVVWDGVRLELPLFPTTRLHVEAAVDAALEGVDMPDAKGDHTRQAPTLAG